MAKDMTSLIGKEKGQRQNCRGNCKERGWRPDTSASSTLNDLRLKQSIRSEKEVYNQRCVYLKSEATPRPSDFSPLIDNVTSAKVKDGAGEMR